MTLADERLESLAQFLAWEDGVVIEMEGMGLRVQGADFHDVFVFENAEDIGLVATRVGELDGL